MTTPHFGAVLTAMITPFDDDGAVDLAMAQQVARHLVEEGNNGLVVAGTTGEAATLTDDERIDLIAAVAEAVTVPVVAGTGSNDTAHSVELTRRLKGIPAAGVLAVGPYYSRPPQAGIEAHFRAMAAATDLPLMVYDVPGRTGRRIATDVLLRLFTEVPNIVAFKDATGDLPAAARLVSEVPSLSLYSGDDPLTLAFLAVGACGVVGVSTHWAATQFAQMIASFQAGDVAAARAINASLAETYDYENSDTVNFSMAAKAMLRTLGFGVGDVRLPLPPTPPEVEDRARLVYKALRG